jgi:hypothetical protein
MFIERCLRQAFGEQPSDSSNITVNLVNQWLNDAIGLAAKQNYRESVQLDGIAYINNSFYSTFTGLNAVAFATVPNTYQLILPQVPIGVGQNEGVRSLRIQDSSNNVSLDCVPLTANQVTYFLMNKPIYNKILYYNEGIYLYIVTTLPLDTGFTCNVTLVSGGDSTNLNSILNVPDDFVPTMISYIMKMLQIERSAPKDLSNDGADNG